MAEQIYTIPINEAFDRKEGCPLCTLAEKLENDSLDYIMGAAMMEPDIRIKTNSLGFCRNHYSKMLSMKNRLSLALMLESHIDELKKSLSVPAAGDRKGLFTGRKKNEGEDAADILSSMSRSCYLCSRIEDFENKYCGNIVWLWKKDRNFRKKLGEQPAFCIPHAGKILKQAKMDLNESEYTDFYNSVMGIVLNCCDENRVLVTEFTKHFDHRSAGVPMGDERYAVENSIKFLSGK